MVVKSCICTDLQGYILCLLFSKLSYYVACLSPASATIISYKMVPDMWLNISRSLHRQRVHLIGIRAVTETLLSRSSSSWPLAPAEVTRNHRGRRSRPSDATSPSPWASSCVGLALGVLYCSSSDYNQVQVSYLFYSNVYL